MCDQGQNIYLKKRFEHSCGENAQPWFFFENIEQLDGHASLPPDRSDKTIEEDLDLAYLPTADDPDTIFQN